MTRPLPTRIAARCTQEFKDQVVEAANYNGDDYSEVIRKALEAYVRRTEKRRNPAKREPLDAEALEQSQRRNRAAWDSELGVGMRV